MYRDVCPWPFFSNAILHFYILQICLMFNLINYLLLDEFKNTVLFNFINNPHLIKVQTDKGRLNIFP